MPLLQIAMVLQRVCEAKFRKASCYFPQAQLYFTEQPQNVKKK
jgi:hypothetical protein